MKSVFILAAGKGTRLAPITDQLPKALVPVLGRPILAYTLDALSEDARAGRCNVAIVVGHLGGKIASYVAENYDFVRIIWNHDFHRTNNMFSLSLAMTVVAPEDDIVFMNGDCLYHESILRKALRTTSESVFCDPEIGHNLESMKISTTNGVITGISKALTKEEAFAVSCDLYTINASSTQILRDVIFEYLSRADLNSWSEIALNDLMSRGLIKFVPNSVEGQYWYEIDNHEDLAAATARVTGTQ